MSASVHQAAGTPRSSPSGDGGVRAATGWARKWIVTGSDGGSSRSPFPGFRGLGLQQRDQRPRGARPSASGSSTRPACRWKRPTHDDDVGRQEGLGELHAGGRKLRRGGPSARRVREQSGTGAGQGGLSGGGGLGGELTVLAGAARGPVGGAWELAFKATESIGGRGGARGTIAGTGGLHGDRPGGDAAFSANPATTGARRGWRARR